MSFSETSFSDFGLFWVHALLHTHSRFFFPFSSMGALKTQLENYRDSAKYSMERKKGKRKASEASFFFFLFLSCPILNNFHANQPHTQVQTI